MSVRSMTGFGRAAATAQGLALAWEVKSVNHRGLDVKLRLPSGFEAVEAPARAAIAARLARGAVQAVLIVERAQATAALRVNPDALAALTDAMAEIRRAVPDAAPPSLDGLMALRGVLETDDPAPDEAALAARDAAVLAALDTALDRLCAARAAEGGKLATILSQQIAEIAALTGEAASLAEGQAGALRDKLRAQIATLIEGLAPLPEERLVQEAALLAQKADIREELDRLAAHAEQARALLGSGEPSGRRLDFLAQEFHREANTLCSKAADIALTRIGLALKAAIEQMREQIQNVE